MATRTQRERRQREPDDEDGRQRKRFRLTVLWIGFALVAILGLAYPLGFWWHNANSTRAVAVFAIGVVSFLGMLSLGHQGSRFRRFESSEVRVAVTTSFVMVYFAILGIFLFSTNRVSDFGQTMVENLSGLFGVVVGFYFASAAVVEYGKSRSGSTTDKPESKPDEKAPAPPPEPVTAKTVVEDELKELRKLVASLLAEKEPPARGNGGTSATPAPAEEPGPVA
jgi:hypothetical protein